MKGAAGAGAAIPLARPFVGEAETRAVADVLASRWLTQGPRVAEFEAAFARAVRAPHAVAVSSCTAALHLCLVALGVGAGDEVICPSLSFIATANAVVHTGAAPVFADVTDGGFNVTAATVAAALTARTRAIVVVHQVGLPADLDELAALAAERGLWLVEDAACAVGSSYHDRPIGQPTVAASAAHPGSLACFSFHPRKLLATGDGGMITLGDPALAARLRRLRHQGMSVSDHERHVSRAALVEQYAEVGYNYRMTDLQAALGLVQLTRLDDFLARRRVLAARYDAAFGGQPALRLVRPPADRATNHQSYVISVSDGLAATRDRLIAELAAAGIASRRAVMCAHREAPYRTALAPAGLAASERTSDTSLCLPIFHELSDGDQDRVIQAVQNGVAAVA